ncbi:hypothetical protein [Sphingorhabdus sp. SMR4y]|uniref:hypothetical protein n=1 Tax=Sphingorhabdus sp. SMR4y TaxID=2584094 RepID=UPI000B61629D|nr:hypothetical protein [Sphingorhabdus sp. SMR4y]ASK89298.1 hypothetical protein SPHFLASMR4Y_02560 [Sphingorhabdus sp. SMR4y]
MMTFLKPTILAAMLLAGLIFGSSAVLAQIPAFLPDHANVERGNPTTADGTYTISSNGKRIVIEDGHGFVVDPWTHALVLRIQPGMVVMDNFRQTGPDRFAADDLPLMGPATLFRQPNGVLQVVVKGSFGPVKYFLTPTDPVFDPVAPSPEPLPRPVVERDRIYQLHIGVAWCQGKSLFRKRYRGGVHLGVKDANGKAMTSKSRSFDIHCNDKKQRVETFAFESSDIGSLTLVVPPGQSGFQNLQISGVINDILGPVDFMKPSGLFETARALGRDLEINENVDELVEVIGGKASLSFRVYMKRVQ